MSDEISVLDYLKWKLKPANWSRSYFPDEIEIFERNPSAYVPKKRTILNDLDDMIYDSAVISHIPLYYIPLPLAWLILILALTAQSFSEPNGLVAQRNGVFSTILYSLCAFVILYTWYRSTRTLDEKEDITAEQIGAPDGTLFPTNFRLEWVLLGGGFGLIAFILFGSNRFNLFNLLFWGLSILCILFSLLRDFDVSRWIELGKSYLKTRIPWRVTIIPWKIAWVIVFCIGVYFSFTQLDQVPSDMFSDHAEKLYDVMDVMNGTTPIFFVRNTGREAFQFYWTALIINLFGTGISFLSLKIGTALAGVFILPFVYLLGKRMGSRMIGLIAMLFCGVAYWHNVIDRVALRFAFYPMFVAPVLYFLMNGLIYKRRRDMILAGIFLGIGLQGYSAMRIVPIFVVLIFFLSLIKTPADERANSWQAFGWLVLFAVLFALPLIRIALTMPDSFFYRAATRLGSSETALQGSAVLVFFTNLWRVILMPFWDNGRIWVHSIPSRPALDSITAAFYFIGLIFLVIRSITKKNWLDWVMLLAIPFLMLPSALSIAFPDENPSLNRTGAAMIPVFCVAAFGFCVCFQQILSQAYKRKLLRAVSLFFSIFLLFAVMKANYSLVFTEYAAQYARNALNTNQIGQVIHGFDETFQNPDGAYVIPYPYWVDTRLVGINADHPGRDYALMREQLDLVKENAKHPLLFVCKGDDTETVSMLKTLFPASIFTTHTGRNSSKDFISCFVP